ncbi:unnamed protein product [Agarophyton chilense]|eukprot:gb/GEZJ01005217.1/.p1 GENE.gb/GEZJ01005217.1/~~gb/GEZJ01005217.1/.p1  ORF type:complete len:489 (+),score=64.98 gb/GEZJ01005217.1/:151-1617(+)
MLLSSRLIATFLVLLTAPILYVSRKKISVELSPSVTPVAPSIHRLQEYLRIRTDHPNPSYLEAQYFLNRTVASLIPNASFSAHNFVQGKPVILIRIDGTNPQLPSLLLNSHTDVVPSEDSEWEWPPYAARTVFKDGELRVYARGSQDMKSVGMQYIEALAELLRTDWRPKRTIFISFVPDEEIGGRDGMGKLVDSVLFQRMNVGVALDEGLPRYDGNFSCYYGERQTWWLAVNVSDRPGHGSNLPETTAASTLNEIINKAMHFRKQQQRRLESGIDMGQIIGVNVAYLKSGHPDEHVSSGFIMNLIPSVAAAGFDIRVPPTVDAKEVDEEIERWLACDDSKRCPGVTTEWVIKVENSHVTSRDTEKNPYAAPFMSGLEKAGLGHRLNHGIFKAATDARYLRMKGIPSFGFSPINKSPDLLHKHNEYLPVDTYLRGIRIYQNIIRDIADFNSSSLEYDSSSTSSDTCKDSHDEQEAAEKRILNEEKEDL